MLPKFECQFFLLRKINFLPNYLIHIQTQGLIMKNLKLVCFLLFLLVNMNIASSFYLGGQISIQNLILKKDNYSLNDFNLEMNETLTSLNFLEAQSPEQFAKSFHLDCKQGSAMADLDLIGIIQRCTNSGKITADEVIVSQPVQGFNDFDSPKEPIAFIFSKAIAQSLEDFTENETTVISDIELLIEKNKFELELIVDNVKPKIKGEIYVSNQMIRIKIISAKVSILSIKAKLLAEIKKMEGQYPIKVIDDVIELTLRN